MTSKTDEAKMLLAKYAQNNKHKLEILFEKDYKKIQQNLYSDPSLQYVISRFKFDKCHVYNEKKWKRVKKIKLPNGNYSRIYANDGFNFYYNPLGNSPFPFMAEVLEDADGNLSVLKFQYFEYCSLEYYNITNTFDDRICVWQHL